MRFTDPSLQAGLEAWRSAMDIRERAAADNMWFEERVSTPRLTTFEEQVNSPDAPDNLPHRQNWYLEAVRPVWRAGAGHVPCRARTRSSGPGPAGAVPADRPVGGPAHAAARPGPGPRGPGKRQAGEPDSAARPLPGELERPPRCPSCLRRLEGPGAGRSGRAGLARPATRPARPGALRPDRRTAPGRADAIHRAGRAG